MEQFIQITGVAAPLMRANIDTDMLIPSREINGPGRAGYGEKLLAPLRYLATSDGSRLENPDFVLNQAPFRNASVLIAGDNFGSGSSREHAAWALRQFGIRCVIAPSFGAIFRGNCHRNGVLPVALAQADVQLLAERARDGRLQLTVDLRECTVTPLRGAREADSGQCFHFTVQQGDRAMLLEGLDAIGLTLKRQADIDHFQHKDRSRRPWIWQPAI